MTNKIYLRLIKDALEGKNVAIVGFASLKKTHIKKIRDLSPLDSIKTYSRASGLIRFKSGGAIALLGYNPEFNAGWCLSNWYLIPSRLPKQKKEEIRNYLLACGCYHNITGFPMGIED